MYCPRCEFIIKEQHVAECPICGGPLVESPDVQEIPEQQESRKQGSAKDLISDVKKDLDEIESVEDVHMHAEDEHRFVLDLEKGADEDSVGEDYEEDKDGGYDLEQFLNREAPAPDQQESGGAGSAQAAPGTQPDPSDDIFELERELGLSDEEIRILEQLRADAQAGKQEAGEPEASEFDWQIREKDEEPAEQSAEGADRADQPPPQADLEHELNACLECGDEAPDAAGAEPESETAQEMTIDEVSEAAQQRYETAEPDQEAPVSGEAEPASAESTQAELEEVLERHDPEKKRPAGKKWAHAAVIAAAGAALIAAASVTFQRMDFSSPGRAVVRQPPVEPLARSHQAGSGMDDVQQAASARKERPANKAAVREPPSETGSQQDATAAARQTANGAPPRPEPEERIPAQGSVQPAAQSPVAEPDRAAEAGTGEPELPKEAGVSVVPASRDTAARYSVHVHSFRNIENAQEQSRRLQSAGFDAYVESIDLNEAGVWHRVKVGRFESRAAAEAAQRELARLPMVQNTLLLRKR